MSFNELYYRKLDQGSAKGIKATLFCVLANMILAVIKVLTGVFGHSYALIADGIESVTDVFSSFVVISGFKIGTKPPDENYPFGYGKAESLAAFIVSFIVIFAAVFIAVKSIFEIITPHQGPAPYTLFILIGVVVVKEIMFRKLWQLSGEVGATFMKADAWHNRSDALTSLAAFIGLSIAQVGGKRYASADEWAALFASGIILWNGIKFYQTAIGELMDEQVPEDLAGKIKRLAAGEAGVLAVEKCRVRKSGRGYFVELHIEVDGKVPVIEGHRVAHQVEDRLFHSELQIIGTVVHVEPHESTAYGMK